MTYIPPARVRLALGQQGLALSLKGLVLGLQVLVLGPRGFSDTNVLAFWQREIPRVGGHTQREDPMQVVLRCSGI